MKCSLLLLSLLLSVATFAQSTVKIDFEKCVADNQTIKLSKLAKSVDYIALETNKDCYLGTIKVYRFLNKLVVVNVGSNAGLFLFDLNGKFIRKIGKTGKGPGEYLQITCIQFDEENNQILVKSSGKEKIIRYSMDGSFSEGISIGRDTYFGFYNSFVFSHTDKMSLRGKVKEIEQLHIFDSSGKQISKFHPVQTEHTKYFDMFMQDPSFSVTRNKLYYFVPKEYKVAEFDAIKCTKQYELGFGKYSFSNDYCWDYNGYQNAKKSNNVRVDDAWFSANVLLLTAWQKGERKLMGHLFGQKISFSKIIDDVDNLKLDYITGIRNNEVIVSLCPVDLLSEKDKLSGKLRSLLRERKEDDNPILKIIKL